MFPSKGATVLRERVSEHRCENASDANRVIRGVSSGCDEVRDET